MEKDQRPILTRETIAQRRRKEIKQAWKRNALFYSFYFAFTGIVFLFVNALSDSWWVPFVVIGPFIFPMLGLLIYIAVENILEYRILKSGRFHIVEDELVRISLRERIYFWRSFQRKGNSRIEMQAGRVFDAYSDDTTYWTLVESGGNKYEDALYFARHGRLAVGRSICNRSSVGDTFYLVVYHNRRRLIEYIYSTKSYRCDPADVAYAEQIERMWEQQERERKEKRKR